STTTSWAGPGDAAPQIRLPRRADGATAAGRAVGGHGWHLLSDGGKGRVLSEEEHAKESVYIQMEGALGEAQEEARAGEGRRRHDQVLCCQQDQALRR
ncbi:unnamed protein product, partial [Urochloa humidicola]